MTVMNSTEQYHGDRSRCLDLLLCQRDYHTPVTPPCGARTSGTPAECELPAGHPGPHVHFVES
jgi:hypothetical protein